MDLQSKRRILKWQNPPVDHIIRDSNNYASLKNRTDGAMILEILNKKKTLNINWAFEKSNRERNAKRLGRIFQTVLFSW